MQNLLLHDFVPKTVANGPGVRSTIWVQGCSLGCVGCINPATHIPMSGDPSKSMSVDAILAKVPDDVQGITLSGGEPLQQDLDAIYYLITKAKDRGLSVVMFTGYAWTEIFQMGSKAIQIFRECDLIISGRYRRDLPPRDSTPLIASENQLLFFPTGRYEKKDLNSVAKLEILFDVREGRTIKTGVNKKEKS